MHIIKATPPRSAPDRSDCLFYHSIDLPGGEHIEEGVDIRGRFGQYIGDYQIKNKTVLDVGTASGFLAFSAEAGGASHVTAVDLFDSNEINDIPFADSPLYRDRRLFLKEWDSANQRLKNSFWYSWHKLASSVEVFYTPIAAFPFWDRKFDVVIAGAIIEHLSDPVTAIGRMAMRANEAVIISFTPVGESDEIMMQAINSWDSHTAANTWWMLSRGLYDKLFSNLGFSVEYKVSRAKMGGFDVERPTIVARRR